HVHWLATGAFQERVSLAHLKNPSDILRISVPEHGEWVLGYGWDFPLDILPQATRQILDQWCADRPVALSRSDGHAVWTNSLALKQAGLLTAQLNFSSDLCPRDASDLPSGILLESARDGVLKLSKSKKEPDLVRQLLKAQSLFHSFGITHIRDVNMDE